MKIINIKIISILEKSENKFMFITNLIKNGKTKKILENFKNFDYSNYLNTDNNKPESSISNDFAIKFIEKNKNFENNFIAKMKIFWRIEFLGFLAFFLFLIGCIIIAAVTKNFYWIIPLSILTIPAFILINSNFNYPLKIILNEITNRVENFKTFELLFNENQFKNFDKKSGPHEFKTILWLKDNWELLDLEKINSWDLLDWWNWNSQNDLNHLHQNKNEVQNENITQNNSTNILSCLYLITKMLLCYFENFKEYKNNDL